MIFKSPHPDVAIPESALRPLVLRHAERLREKVAIVEAGSGRSYTYFELAANATKLGAGLDAKGFGKGDVMAILAPNLVGNCPDWDQIRAVADAHGLLVIEDSCDVLDSWLRGTRTGTRADIDGLKTSIERQVKEHPGRTLLIAIGMGYLIGKAFRR